jgi:hypothetical protein
MDRRLSIRCASFEEEHRDSAVLCETAGEYTACGPRADDDIIIDTFATHLVLPVVS